MLSVQRRLEHVGQCKRSRYTAAALVLVGVAVGSGCTFLVGLNSTSSPTRRALQTQPVCSPLGGSEACGGASGAWSTASTVAGISVIVAVLRNSNVLASQRKGCGLALASSTARLIIDSSYCANSAKVTPVPSGRCNEEGGAPLADRRSVIASMFAAAIVSCGFDTLPARAAGEAPLPDGARQEDRVRVAVDKWKEVGTKTSGGDLTNEDWESTQGFLRRLYSVKDDMLYLSRGFAPEKKAKASAMVESFQKQIKAADKPAKVKDAEKFMVFHKEIADDLDEFIGMLNDAPSDLEVGEEFKEISVS